VLVNKNKTIKKNIKKMEKLLRDLVKKGITVIGLTASVITIQEFKNRNVTKKYLEDITEVKENLNKINAKLDDLAKNNSISNISNEENIADQGNKILDTINTEANFIKTTIEKEKISQIDGGNNELISSKFDELNKNFYKFKENIVDKITEIMSGKGSSNTNAFIEKISDIINAYRDFLSTLSTAEVGSLAHILICIVIFISLLSLISIFLGDYLIRYFNLEIKYSKLARFIQIRRKFQIYYFIFNTIIILLGLLAIIYLNILTFI